MRTHRSKDLVRKAIERPGLPDSPVPEGGAESGDLKNWIALDLEEARRVAAARLKEGWISPDTANHPVAAALVEELAALLCAYGLLAKEAERMRTGAEVPPQGTRPARKRRRRGPIGISRSCV